MLQETNQDAQVQEDFIQNDKDPSVKSSASLAPVIWIRGRNKSVTIGEVSANGFEQVEDVDTIKAHVAEGLEGTNVFIDSPRQIPELTAPDFAVAGGPGLGAAGAKVTAKSLADTDEDTSDQETAIKEVLQSHLTHMVRSCSSPGLFVAGGSEAGMILRRETSLGGEIPLDMKFSVQGEPADPVKQAATSQDTGAGDEQTTKENNSSESSSESEDEGNL
ncbi:unnamed protein product, partial [Symbiodinium sp. KB8]